MKIDRKKIYALALFYCGSKNQIIVAIEEMSELQKELSKFLRGKGDYNAMVEEVADVKIMIEQVQFIFGIRDDEIESVMDEKMMRTRKRLQRGEL